MAIAYGCILITALLPYLWIAVAKTGAPGYNNRNPRAWVAKQEGNYRVQRANAAHLNGFEAFPAFVAGVLMAQLAGVPVATITALAVTFTLARFLHGLFYLADLSLLRSLVWFVGFGSALALMVLAALRVG
ncbi:MAPEG family protein [Pseudoxanthomonas mexicana]|uniref:MAPEG family protein n=1 Tax=Pseudoxanthomonas mexicana TaxID=128785 RepID=UPI00398B068C